MAGISSGERGVMAAIPTIEPDEFQRLIPVAYRMAKDYDHTPIDYWDKPALVLSALVIALDVGIARNMVFQRIHVTGGSELVVI